MLPVTVSACSNHSYSYVATMILESFKLAADSYSSPINNSDIASSHVYSYVASVFNAFSHSTMPMPMFHVTM